MIAICNSDVVVYLLSDLADISQWPHVVDGENEFINGIDFYKTVVEGVDLPEGAKPCDCENVDGVVQLKAGPTVAQAERVAGLKAMIEQIEGDHPITPRQLRELALIVRYLIMAVAPHQPPVHGLEIANELDAQIVALRAAMVTL